MVSSFIHTFWKLFFIFYGFLCRAEANSGGGGRHAPPFLAIPCCCCCCCCFLGVFCNHYEKLQTVLFEVELIINKKPLAYVYPNTIETCFRPSHLLFDRQLLYSYNTISTVVRNLTGLSNTTDKINCISNHFLDRWRHGYVVNSHETQQTSKLNRNTLKINVNDIVLIFYEKVLRNFWRIAIVTQVLPCGDSEIREAIVRIAKTNTILKHPVKKLFAVENTYHDTNQTDKAQEQKFKL